MVHVEHNSWTISEVVHAIIIICTFTSLSGLAHGLGVNLEADLQWDRAHGDTADSVENLLEAASDEHTVRILETLKAIDSTKEDELDEVDKAQLWEQAGEESEHKGNSSTIARRKNSQSFEWMKKYTSTDNMEHTDFNIRSREYTAFNVSDYSWHEHGYSLVSKFFSEAATCLDEEFDHIFTLTYNTFSQANQVDTFPFRRAIWYYIHRVRGLIHDDYNYEEVNKFLPRNLKAYIKYLVCEPVAIELAHFVTWDVSLTLQEKCHVALIAAEASKQADLLYGLHAVMRVYEAR
mmetsp:Transcript_53436/g.134271  ORF Transcript_53436/g.134271 Transcript_53436/m.134271 type:complete len:292 (+) Transcript_53436:1055-1930(+)|eukprot:CAMPEP_0177652528 /NCGR_PEP_ID=MMETSP0447-20121125/13185_1 /TAXON_ID=0 /ORGANISM="Stygamoeba regulata, Strain BSH-02190019" /LENGTH=291 /DNA_ID=CAMNT_0019155793 /DNA_START=1035 /DNA_END=1910 /DNA_ORIENTATION=+